MSSVCEQFSFAYIELQNKKEALLELMKDNEVPAEELREQLDQLNTTRIEFHKEMMNLADDWRFGEIKKFWRAGADKDSIAQSLAGISSPESMELRERLIADESVSNYYVALSLTGVSTPEAMEMHERLIADESVDNIHVAESLAGVSTPESMEMRERLIADESVSNYYVARSLAGVSSPESIEMREQLLSNGVSKGNVALSFSGDRFTRIAWESAYKYKYKLP